MAFNEYLLETRKNPSIVGASGTGFKKVFNDY